MLSSIKIISTVILLGLFGIQTASAQTGGMVKKHASATSLSTETVKVLGNCGMCKKNIEKAALSAGASTASWDMDKDLLSISFDPGKTSLDAIEKAVAQSGYDNAGYKAPDKAYNNLHACCQYDREEKK